MAERSKVLLHFCLVPKVVNLNPNPPRENLGIGQEKKRKWLKLSPDKHQKKQSKVGNTVMILVSCLNKYFTVGHRWAPIPKVGYTLMRVVRCQPKSVIAFERWTPKPKVGNTLTILVSC